MAVGAIVLFVAMLDGLVGVIRRRAPSTHAQDAGTPPLKAIE
jgi:hypothetical protein